MVRKLLIFAGVLALGGLIVFYLWTNVPRPDNLTEENTTATTSYSVVSPVDALAAAAAAKIAEQTEKGVLSSQKSGTPVTGDVISKSAPPPEGRIEYRNEKYGFSYYRSPEAKITEYDEGGGAMTLVHENFEKVRGFQVYIVPYNQPLITEAQFRKDVPSGVRKNVEETTLDGVRAVTFNSIDESLGETREIWVIHNGYLYEITTFTGVGQWFTPIIQSWRFI